MGSAGNSRPPVCDLQQPARREAIAIGPPMSALPVPETKPSDVTRWLQELEQVNSQASSALSAMLYEELRRMARSHLRRERATR